MQTCKHHCYISEKVSALDKLWIIGDNFIAETYRINFKKSTWESYMKDNFDVTAFCSSKYSDKNSNVISRMQITMSRALNDNTYLPKVILLVPESDIINSVNYEGTGISTILGELTEWIVTEVDNLIDSKLKTLSQSAKRRFEPFIYWLSPPTHYEFTSDTKNNRNKFALCLEAIVKKFHNMRVIKLKDNWNIKDSNLVVNNRLTTVGNANYWKAIDASLHYNVSRKDDYITRESFKSLNVAKTKPPQEIQQRRVLLKDNRYEVEDFFTRKRKHDRFGSYGTNQEDTSRNPKDRRLNKFLLPKPRIYNRN